MVRRSVFTGVTGCALAATTIGGGCNRQPAATQPAANDSAAESAAEAPAPSEKIIVGEQAQQNLKIVSKPLATEVFWKTIAIQGMIVDRPGLSDREVVAPTTGTISELFQVPGDLVSPGDKLFTLKLASEALQATQTELFKTTQDIALAEARRERLLSAGAGIPRVRIIEVEGELARLAAAAQGYRQELLNRGLSSDAIDGVAQGKLLTEITLTAPPRSIPRSPLDDSSLDDVSLAPKNPAIAYEFQELLVDLGQQVQAGQTLCHLSNHQLLAIEGRAFRDETSLLEKSVEGKWPVEVDFQEDASANWPPLEQPFQIRYIANTIDPITRTFAFLMPLENQSKTVNHGETSQLLWRFRPGQKVLLRIRVEKIENVFVLPADAVVMEGADAYVFTQNSNTFERKSVQVVHRDRDQVVLANDGALPTYKKNDQAWTIAAVTRAAASQLNRMTKSGGSSDVPAGYHIHADGSLHKNEEVAKE